MFHRISLPSLLVTLSLAACATSNKQASPDELSPGAPSEAETTATVSQLSSTETKKKTEVTEKDADAPMKTIAPAAEPVAAAPSLDSLDGLANYDDLSAAEDYTGDARQRVVTTTPMGLQPMMREQVALAPKAAPARRDEYAESLGTRGVVGGTVASGPAASTGYAAPPPPPAKPVEEPAPYAIAVNTEGYTNYGVNPMTLTEKDAQSTFSIDVDTASYTISRRKLQEGGLPPADSVRVEEFVNYFPYHYASPGKESGSAPFAVHLEAAPNPFQPSHHVVRVGVKGRDTEQVERKPLHLTFLVDTSGSMSSSDKLGLAQKSLEYLVSQLGEEDTVALVTYAGSTQVMLEPTSADQRAKITAAIQRLTSGGGTAMGSGMELAYRMADKSFESGAENRVIVLSDGDANIGRTSHDEILAGITGYAKKGITMSTIGFGMGNYQDTMMEQLANKGDGNYYYIDSYDEAKKVFGQDLAGTIQVIAKDVKIQVEFNPEAVLAYRLIGYENRDIADRDFRNDAVDAGEIGAGHMVTALYDVVLRDGYRAENLATVRLRAKPPGADAPAKEWSTTLKGGAVHSELASASKDMRLAFGAACFAELLRNSPYAEEMTYQAVYDIVRAASRGGKEETELQSLILTAAGYANQTVKVASR
ncbi:VWA domain-containing protein [Myxococcota bacterium]|nr:VWA domain-containing protein [Myxococcota bacterium]